MSLADLSANNVEVHACPPHMYKLPCTTAATASDRDVKRISWSLATASRIQSLQHNTLMAQSFIGALAGSSATGVQFNTRCRGPTTTIQNPDASSVVRALPTLEVQYHWRFRLSPIVPPWIGCSSSRKQKAISNADERLYLAR